jgi:hypothetical protein
MREEGEEAHGVFLERILYLVDVEVVLCIASPPEPLEHKEDRNELPPLRD